MGLRVSVLEPALGDLRDRWAIGAALVAAGAAAIVSALPVTTLIGPGFLPRLGIPASARDVHWLDWSARATPPEALREAALIAGLRGLAGVTACVLVIIAAVLGAVAIARAGRTAPTLRVRRAVGASRRHLILGELVQGGVFGIAAAAVGGLAAVGIVWAALAAWPGAIAPLPFTPTGPMLLGVVGVLILGAMLAVPVAGAVRPEAGSPTPVPLLVPILLIAVCSVALATADALDERADHAAPVPPGVTAVAEIDGHEASSGMALASPGLLTGLGMVDQATTDCGACFAGGIAVQWHQVSAAHHLASADTFAMLGLDLMAGRLFTARDGATSPPVAIVSASMASRHFQRGEAVGRRMLIGHDTPTWYTVIGVVSDRPPLVMGASDLPRRAVYLSPAQHEAATLDLLLPPGAILPAGVENVRPAEAVFAEATAPVAWLADRFRFAGLMGIVSALVGTIIVMAGWGRALVPDLGIHRAVGARRRHVVRHVASRIALMTLLGIVGGLWLGPMLWGAFFPHFVLDVAGPLAVIPRVGALLGVVALLTVIPVTRGIVRRAPVDLLRSAP